MALPAHIKKKKDTEADVKADSEESLLAIRLMELKDDKTAQEEALSATQKDIDATELRLAEIMETKGIDLFRVPDVGTFSTKLVNYPSVQDGSAFIDWLDANGMGAIAKRTVNPMTLKGWVNNWLEEGKTLPPTVNNFVKTRINTRRAK